MTTVREIMTRKVRALDVELSLREAMEELRARDISGAPVTAGGKFVGVVSVTDILEFQATHPSVPRYQADQPEWGDFPEPEAWEAEAEDRPGSFFVDMWPDAGADALTRMGSSDGPEWDQLDEHTVGEIMSRKIVHLEPDTDLHDAAKRMLDARVSRVLVMTDGALEGILSTTDIVRAVAERRV